MRYGLPYMGSKNAIVPFILQVIPKAQKKLYEKMSNKK